MRTTPPLREISGAEAKAEVSMAVAPIRTTRRWLRRRAKAGRPRAGDRELVVELAPATGAQRRRVEAAQQPRRSSDEAPPWQRGPDGRIEKWCTVERRDDIPSSPRRRVHNSLQRAMDRKRRRAP
jgi:hypothetical protein